MAQDVNNDAQVLDDDLNTTVPHPEPAVWKMPEPVFRKTSGKLPKDFEKNYLETIPSVEAVGEDESDANVEAEEDNDSGNAVETYAEPKPKSPVLKIVVVLLGVAAMVGFIVAFLSVLYFMFLR